MSSYSTYLLEVGLKINSEFISGQYKREIQLISYCVHKIKINQFIGEKHLLLILGEKSLLLF